VDTEWQVRCEEHRHEISRFLADVERLDESAWLQTSAPGKWCPGQIAEHLVLGYEALLRELAGGVGIRARGTWWQRLLIRWRYLSLMLEERHIPSGVRAVREVRPPDTPRPRPTVVTALREATARFEEELTRAREKGGGHRQLPGAGAPA